MFLILVAGSYAAGYFTRDYISRVRRAEARRRRHQLDHPNAANSNESGPQVPGELGQMLSRWESRARERRLQQARTEA